MHHDAQLRADVVGEQDPRQEVLELFALARERGAPALVGQVQDRRVRERQLLPAIGPGLVAALRRQVAGEGDVEVDVEAGVGIVLQRHQAAREVAAVGLVAREAGEQRGRMLVREAELRVLPRIAARPLRRDLAVHRAGELAQFRLRVVAGHRTRADVLLDQRVQRKRPHRDARMRLDPLQLRRGDRAGVVLVQPQLVARLGMVAQEAAEVQLRDRRQLARPVAEERDGRGVGRHQ